MILPGQKIALRDWTFADLPAYDSWLQPGHTWKQFDAPYYPEPTPEERWDIIDKQRAQIVTESGLPQRQTLVIASAQTDQLIGMVSRYWISEETHWTAIGITIYDPAYWRQGFGYEALGLWSDYLFREIPEFVRLDLRTWSGNHGMMHLAQKLGYREEARFRKARIVAGQYYDGLGYGILRDEWNARFPDGFSATSPAQ